MHVFFCGKKHPMGKLPQGAAAYLDVKFVCVVEKQTNSDYCNVTPDPQAMLPSMETAPFPLCPLRSATCSPRAAASSKG